MRDGVSLPKVSRRVLGVLWDTMACGSDELQIAAVCHLKFINKESVHKHIMAWIFIASTIPIALWDTHRERADPDLDHRRTIFSRGWREQRLRRLVSCEERG